MHGITHQSPPIIRGDPGCTSRTDRSCVLSLRELFVHKCRATTFVSCWVHKACVTQFSYVRTVIFALHFRNIPKWSADGRILGYITDNLETNVVRFASKNVTALFLGGKFYGRSEGKKWVAKNTTQRKEVSRAGSIRCSSV